MKWLAELPTTNFRIFVTTIVMVATAATYLWTAREADGQWLAFLAVMAGIDAGQYFAKRGTYKEQPPSPPAPAPVAAAPDREDAPAADPAPATATRHPPALTPLPDHVTMTRDD